MEVCFQQLILSQWLINLLGHQYVVWDKSAQISFKRPGNVDLYAEFIYTKEELEQIIEQVERENEIEIVKTTQLTNKSKTTVYCEVKKLSILQEKLIIK